MATSEEAALKQMLTPLGHCPQSHTCLPLLMQMAQLTSDLL